MAIAKYPEFLRLPLLNGNDRAQEARFTMSEPRSGPPYIRKLPDNQPIIYTFNFTFVGDERVIFYTWFDETLEKGVKPFLMPINTEFGLIDCECRFMPDNLLNNTQLTYKVFTYSAQVLVRRLNYEEFTPPGIPEYPDYYLNRNLLDVIINLELPEA